MSFGSWRRFDVQARWAARLGTISVAPAIGAVWLVLRNYRHELGQIVYGEGSLYVPALLGCTMLGILTGGLGLILGWNSAGRRRNDRPGHAWLGFFVGGAVTTASIIVLLAFIMLRLEHPT